MHPFKKAHMGNQSTEYEPKDAMTRRHQAESGQEGLRDLPPPLRLRLAGAVFRARLALFWERLWPRLWPLVMISGGFALYLALGLPLYLPGWVHLAVLFFFFGLVLWAVKEFVAQFPAWPDENEALARLERESHLPHNPLRTLADKPAAPAADARAQTLWQRHRERLLRSITRLRAGLPRSQVPARDPYALRFALALALIAAFLLGGAERMRASLHALYPRGLPQMTLTAATAIDAWLTPPAYTGKRPIVLAAAGRTAAPKDDIVVPEKSRLSIRITGADDPQLVLYALNPDGSAGKRLARLPFKPLVKSEQAGTGARSAGDRRSWTLEHVIDRPLIVALTDGGELVRWRIATVPDLPPEVRLVKTPSATLRGGLVLSWEATDDYGVSRLRARIRLDEASPEIGKNAPSHPAARKTAGKETEKTNKAGTEKTKLPKGPLSYPPPDFDIPLPAGVQQKAKGTYTRMLADHPWAGLPVILTLEASDQAGNVARSAPHRFILPGRVFRHPLARALIEQRRLLVRHPRKAPEIAVMLAAFTLWPEGLIEDSGVYLGLRQAALKLHTAKNENDLREIVAALWHLATRIEDGDAANALRDLQAARKALEEALERGASPEEIERLMQNLREAMNRYLQGLAEQARRRMQNGMPPMATAPAQRLSPEDFQRMLDKLEDLARTGSRDAARQLLSELDAMLQNLQPMTGNAMPSPEQRALSQMHKLMREQQKLMDETYQARPNEGTGNPFQSEQELYEDQPNRPGNRQGSAREGRNSPPGDWLGQRPRLPDLLPQNPREGSGAERDRAQTRPNGARPERPGPGNRGRNQAAPGNRAGGDETTPSLPDLAERQQDLARRLQQMMEALGNRGLPVPEALKRSGREMEQAGRALKNGRRGRALNHQRRALDSLRRAARDMARRMAQGQGRGQPGLMMPDGVDLDPLGRPMRQFGESFGPRRDILPPESAIERARRILKALRERAARPDRPRRELDYIDRLLRGLY